MAKLKNYTYDAIARLTLDSDFNLEDLGYGENQSLYLLFILTGTIVTTVLFLPFVASK